MANLITPCDFGECPYDVYSGDGCRNHCGLGVDEDSYPDEYDYDEEFCYDYDY